MSIFKTFKYAFMKGFTEAFLSEYAKESPPEPRPMVKRKTIEDRSWSVWYFETRNGIQLVSVQGAVDGAIPEDGSFLSGHLLSTNLTEEEADKFVAKFPSTPLD